jgi:Protein of unknown function (DUF3606)
LKRRQGAPFQAAILTYSSGSSGFANWHPARSRHIGGESNAGLVCTAGGRAGSDRDCDYRCVFVAMTIVDRNGPLQGPADRNRIDVHSPAEMRHWARELSRPGAKIMKAVEIVGPLLADVREYLRTRSIYERPQ